MMLQGHIMFDRLSMTWPYHFWGTWYDMTIQCMTYLTWNDHIMSDMALSNLTRLVRHGHIMYDILDVWYSHWPYNVWHVWSGYGHIYDLVWVPYVIVNNYPVLGISGISQPLQQLGGQQRIIKLQFWSFHSNLNNYIMIIMIIKIIS